MADALLTIPGFFARAMETRAGESALGEIRGGNLRWRTWSEIGRDVEALAGELRLAGVGPGDRVAQVSENRYEWIIVDLALHSIGAVHVPIHVTLSGEQIAEQIAASEARIVFVSTTALVEKVAPQLKHGETIRVHDEQNYSQEKPLLREPPVAPGKSSSGASPSLASPDDLATILFTSGTTGRPRGVMLSQRNLAWNAATTAETHGTSNVETRINILPLSHIYARTCDLYTWLYRRSRLVLAESRETLIRDCQLVHPTVLNGVPYLYERIADRARAPILLGTLLGAQMKQLTCGGAPIATNVEEFFAEQGLPLLPGYGLTETSPVISVSTPDARKIGSVGRPLTGLDVRIADDGEVLVRGPNVMLGYWQDDPATADAIRDGWLHTGDLGHLDADGFLAIRGRKKELIVLSTGKKVSPTRVEALLTASPFIEQVAVFGEGRPGLVALVKSAYYGEPEGYAQLLSDEKSRSKLRASLAFDINRRLAGAAQEEQIRDFVILERPFSIERGELTPKLSLCRAVIGQNFARELTGLGIVSK